MPHRHSHEKTQSRGMKHRTSRRGVRRASDETYDKSSDFSASEESGSVSPLNKNRAPWADAAGTAGATVSAAPIWLQGLPTPARANLGKKEEYQQECPADATTPSSAATPSYRELLRARGKELIRHSKNSQRNGAQMPQSAFCDASSNASTDVPGVSPGVDYTNTSGQTFDGTSGFCMSPISPHLQTNYHMPMTGSTVGVSDFGMPLGMMDYGMPPPYNLQLSHALLSSTGSESTRQYHDMDQMMSTLMPESHAEQGWTQMDKEELAAQLRAAVPCCYED